MAPPTALPSFKRPPVVEVALSVMFESVSLNSSHVGVLWGQHFRPRFPKTQDQPPLDTPIEVEHERVPSTTQPRVLLGGVPRLRTWFLNETGTELVQLQHNRFAHNWRRTTSEPYPRYEKVRGSFEGELKLFMDFLHAEGLGELKPTQCEVTYVNHIVAGDVWSTHSELDKVFSVWVRTRSEFLPPPDDGRLLVRYLIFDSNKAFAGRLHVDVQPAFIGEGKDERPIFAATVTARGKPLGDGVAGALAFLDLGREWIVRGFADLTTTAMHDVWGRER